MSSVTDHGHLHRKRAAEEEIVDRPRIELGTASGGRREKPTPASVIGAMLAFVETCLVGDGASASSE